MTQPLADRRAGILSDAELLGLSELTPFTEGEPVFMMLEDGEPVGGFWDIAAEAAKATATAAARITTGQGRALLAMRAFYFLGVLRGGEAYRNSVLDADTEPEFRDIPLALEQGAAADFADDLNELTPEYFNKLLALLGISVPWAADGGKEERNA